MHILLPVAALLALIAGPSLWVRRVMRRYARPMDRYGRDGRETARRLLDGSGLGDVKVEMTESGDHYDPEARAVRLSADNYRGRSLTAVTIAAHEVGHALQDAEGFAPLKWRTRLVHWVGPVEKTGAVLMMATPIIIAITRLPVAGLLMLLGGLLTLGSAVIIHLLTLPTEFDASFKRALPLLVEGAYIPPEDVPAARRILMACALTYVTNALVGLLNVWRWIRILRR